ncbi:DoxX family protein, partial [Bradyrhizobium sp. CSA207]|nr:DoxX family protein [Bradyrhizobium sp. CSA207]
MARAIAIIVARIIFSFVFFMAAGFKFADIGATAGYIT